MINSFKVFREAYLLGGDYPHQKIYMLQHFMNNNFTNLNYQRLSTASVLMGVFIVFLVYILYKFEGKNNVV
jgi:multiple sugar transport system permease protein